MTHEGAPPEQPEYMQPHIHHVPVSVDITPKSVKVSGFRMIHGDVGSLQEAKEIFAQADGDSPEDHNVRRVQAKEVFSRASRSFGFSNWSGSRWEPSGPPKPRGNPNLN